jgi:hypothetical protein
VHLLDRRCANLGIDIEIIVHVCWRDLTCVLEAVESAGEYFYYVIAVIRKVRWINLLRISRKR